MENKCKICQQGTAGHKCADCGEESEAHDERHTCGTDRCMPKCAECNEAEENCSCPAPVADQ